MSKLPTTNDMSASLLDAAKTSAEGVRTLTGEALGAAAAAAAEVVMGGVAKALGKGEETIAGATPAVTETVKDTVTEAIAPPPRKRRAVKRKVFAKKRKAAPKRAAKRKMAAKKRSVKKTKAKAKRKAPAKRRAKTVAKRSAKATAKRKAKRSRR